MSSNTLLSIFKICININLILKERSFLLNSKVIFLGCHIKYVPIRVKFAAITIILKLVFGGGMWHKRVTKKLCCKEPWSIRFTFFQFYSFRNMTVIMLSTLCYFSLFASLCIKKTCAQRHARWHHCIHKGALMLFSLFDIYRYFVQFPCPANICVIKNLPHHVSCCTTLFDFWLATWSQRVCHCFKVFFFIYSFVVLAFVTCLQCPHFLSFKR